MYFVFSFEINARLQQIVIIEKQNILRCRYTKSLKTTYIDGESKFTIANRQGTQCIGPVQNHIVCLDTSA